MKHRIKYIMITTIIILAILITGCAEDTPKETAPQPTEESAAPEVEKMPGKKILMVIAPDGFRDEEFLEPKEIFDSSGAEVTVASKGVSVAKGKLGATANVDIDIGEATATDYDAVVFIGGPGAAVYFDDPTALKLAKDAYAANKVVAAICIAPSILANAGVLEGHKATCFESESENIAAKSEGYTGEPVTIDENIVTGNGPGAAKKFGEAVIKTLG
jgi:protease I